MAYNPDMCEIVHNYALLGAGKSEICQMLRISEAQFDSWLDEHEDFLGAYQAGGMIADGKVAKALFDRATGMKIRETKVAQFDGKFIETDIDVYLPPDVNAAKAWLNARRPQQWSPSQKIDHGLTSDFASLMSNAADEETE